MPPSDWVARKTPTLSCSYVARCDPGEQYSAEHLANSASFGLVVSPEGGVLMDPGGCERGVGRITIFYPQQIVSVPLPFFSYGNPVSLATAGN